MNWERDDNFTKNQIKGIDLTIKAISKKYPFIKGWRFIDNYQQWKAHLYIDIIVNWDEVAEFYGKEVKPYWQVAFKNGDKVDSSLIDSYMFDNPSHTEEGYQEYFDKSFMETKKIGTLINSIYSSLPKEFQVEMKFNSIFGPDIRPVELYIERFTN